MIFLGDFFLIVWVVFWLYWFISATGSKKNVNRRISSGIYIRLGMIFVILILFKYTHIQRGTDQQLFGSNIPEAIKIIIRALGTILFLAGLSFAVWARRHLGRNWGMPMSEKAEPELITTGPYRYVRHPIYTGLIFAALGTAIAQGLYWSIVFIVFLVYFTYSAVHEEKYLTAQFGNKYLDYKRRSKMLIPFIF